MPTITIKSNGFNVGIDGGNDTPVANATAVLALLDQATLRNAEARDLAPVIEELKQLKDKTGEQQ